MLAKRELFFSIIFVITALVDVALIIFAAINQYTIILGIMVVIGLGGAYILFNIWNEDERTDSAIDEASRLTIKVFLILLSVIGISLLLLSDILGITYYVGTALVIAALLLIYLQAIVSVAYAEQMV